MNDIKIIKKLGIGVMGTTYLVSINKKRYVAKIEKILESDIQYDLSKQLWREIEFSKFAKKHPNRFMSLKSWEILSGCEHMQPDPPEFIQAKERKELLLKNESTYCSKLIYEPVLDNTLQHFFNTENSEKKFYAMMCQIIYSLHLLIKNGYIHDDIHSGNIMYKKTNEKTINLDTVSIPTFGFQWYIIDYGLIYHNDFKITGSSKKVNRHSDLISFILNTVEMPIWKVVEKNKLKVAKFENLMNKIRKSPEYETIKKYIPDINEQNTIDNGMAILFLLNFPILYHKFMNIDVVKYKKYILNYKDYNIEMYRFMIKNIDKPMSIIKYIKKLI
jgi:serine/threonine protein kinase